MSKPVDNLGGGAAGAEILARFQTLQDQQIEFAKEWQEIADYVMPRKNSITVDRYPGQRRTNRLYESTAIEAREKLASSIHGTLMPSYLQWFMIEPEDEDIAEIQSVSEWCQDSSARLRGFYKRSNLDQESHEVMNDLTAFATGCLFGEEAPRTADGSFGGFRFRSVNVGKFVAAEGPDGRVNTLFRHFPMTVAAIRQRWLAGDSVEALEVGNPKALKDALKDQKDDRQLKIVHGVYPSSDLLHPSWTSQYLLMLGKVALSRGSFKEFPFMVPRWAKIEDEVYGRGPAHDALPDIKSLNMITYLELKGMAKYIDPPFLSGPDVVGPVRLVPAGQTVVRGDPRAAIALFPAPPEFQMGNVKSTQLQQSIRAIFFYDQLQLPQGPQMTAEEVTTRMELMYRLLGPTVGRLEAELLRPLIDRTWAILLRAHLARPQEGLLPPIPPELQAAQEQGAVRLRVKFEGPLARAQKSIDVNAIQALGAFVTPLAQIAPEAIDVIDFDEGVREFASDKGVPARIIRDKDAVAKIRSDRAAQQQQEQQQQAAMQTAQAAGAAAPALKAAQQAPAPGSMVSQMSNPAPAGGSNGAAA